MNIKSFLWYERKLSILFFGCMILINIIIFSGIIELSYDSLAYLDVLIFIIYLIIMISDFIRVRNIAKKLSCLVQDSRYEELADTGAYNDELLKIFAKVVGNYYLKINEDKYRLVKEQKDFTDYIISFVHTAKTPITALKLMLEHEVSNGTDSIIFDKVEDELVKIENYLEQAIYYIRIDEFEKDFMVAQYGVKEMVHNVIKKFSKLFIEKRIVLDLDISDVKVITDKKSLEFVLQQVIVNSLKYMRENGKLKIWVEDDGGKVKLIIEDNGVGIKVEDLPRVFEKGFTGYNGRVHEHSTGMGLYLAKKICEQLGHEILIEAEVGRFTRVRVVFRY